MRQAFRIYAIEERDAVDSAEIRVRLRRSGRQIGTIDAMLAAVAIRYGLVLLTADHDFDAVPGLLRANWLAA